MMTECSTFYRLCIWPLLLEHNLPTIEMHLSYPMLLVMGFFSLYFGLQHESLLTFFPFGFYPGTVPVAQQDLPVW